MADRPPPSDPGAGGLKPRPGARGAAAFDPFADPFALPPAAVTGTPSGAAAGGSSAPAGPAMRGGFEGADPELPIRWAPDPSPLVTAAQPLLALVLQLRETLRVTDLYRLREDLSQGIRSFEREAAAAGVEREAILAGRYLLCTFIDECAASTPWGGQGVWAPDSMLVRFHNEAWGGEKAFRVLARLAEAPEKNRSVLMLFARCLDLGFGGRYLALPNGRAQLEQLRDRLHAMVDDKEGQDSALALSAQWAPAVVERRHWYSGAPFWVAGVFAAAIAFGGYLFYAWSLAPQADVAFNTLASLRLGETPRPAAVPAPKPRLAQLLAPEVAAGLLTVEDSATRSVVVLRGDISFDPGSAQVSSRMRPVLDKIARALETLPGAVLISGHSDATPIRTARFPSNWHLSRDRAAAVMQVLARSVPPSRMQAEGRAATEPIASNETVTGRAQNRRVEIELFVTP